MIKAKCPTKKFKVLLKNKYVTKSNLHRITSICKFVIALLFFYNKVEAQNSSVSFITAYGYDSCVLLKNNTTEVVLEPNAGGRVIRYAYKGVNVLYEDSLQNGWISTAKMPRSKGHLAGGRFDIGPSRTKPNTDLFFFGKWKAIITGKLSARLISQIDTLTNIFLIRDFTLDERTSKLRCTQTIVNKGSKPFAASFWSRTFANGNGICVMPVPVLSRFPNKYIMFMNRDTINMFPKDANIYTENIHLIIKGSPQKPKLEMDVAAPAWIAYAETNNLLFVKKFRVDTNKLYGDVTAANTSIWYNGTQMTEIEPIGSMETILPGKKVSFTEEWFIMPFEFPANRVADVGKIKNIVLSVK